MNTISPSSGFLRQFKKIVKHNHQLKQLIIDTLKILELDPFTHSLRSHQVQTKIGGVRWSSRVTGDLRIIWDFHENDNKTIDLYDLGGHSGSSKVYN